MPPSYQNRQRGRPPPRSRKPKPSSWPSIPTIAGGVVIALLAGVIGWSRYSLGQLQRTNLNDKEWAEHATDALGTAHKVIATAAQTDGDYIKVAWRIRANAPAGGYQRKPGSPPLHLHVNQTESFEVLKGVASYHSEKVDHTAAVGESFSVGVGLPHTFWNDQDTDLEVEVTLTPGRHNGHDADRFFATFGGLCLDYKGCENIPPLQLLYTFVTHGVYVVDIPPPVWSVFEVVIPPLASLFGYQHTYDQYNLKFVPSE